MTQHTSEEVIGGLKDLGVTEAEITEMIPLTSSRILHRLLTSLPTIRDRIVGQVAANNSSIMMALVTTE